MLKYFALGAIRVYQTVLSPYKGFRCAYAACTGGASCSVLGYRAIRRHGVVKGMAVLQLRFDQCKLAYQRMPRARPMALGNQRGDCDCGGCDSGGSGGCSSCDVLQGIGECASDIGSCGSEKKSQRRMLNPPRRRSWLGRQIDKFRRRR